MLLEKLLGKLQKKADELSTKLDAEELEKRFWKSWKKSGKEDLPEIGEIILWTLKNNDNGWRWRSADEEPSPRQWVVINSNGVYYVSNYLGEGEWEYDEPEKGDFWLPLPPINQQNS